jgi:ATP-dependent Clp protease ATP-binding subunit ClpB
VRRLLAERKISLELTDAAKDLLFAAGFDPSFGARPLKRAIQKKIETPVGRLLLKGAIRDGQTVLVDEPPSREELTFIPEPVEVEVGG